MPAATGYQWNPAALTVTVIRTDINQPHVVTGFAPDSFVSVDPAEDSWSDRASGDGRVVTRSKNNNPMGEVTIVLEQASASNDFLQSALRSDMAESNAILSISVVDENGNERASATHAWLRRQPSNAYGAEAGTRTWVFRGLVTIDTRGSDQLF